MVILSSCNIVLLLVMVGFKEGRIYTPRKQSFVSVNFGDGTQVIWVIAIYERTRTMMGVTDINGVLEI